MHAHAYLVNGSPYGTISPLDRGLAYGDGIFRTMKVVDGLPQCWPLHYQKLVADCGAIGIVCPGAEVLMADIQLLFSADETAVAKIIITRGESERGYSLPAVTTPMRVIIKSAVPQIPDTSYSAGVKLAVCETRLSHQPRLAGIKHLNRLDNVMARMEWHDPSIMDGILLDTQHHVIECTAANIFARFGNTLVTPSLAKCGVAGVTRQRILEFAHTLDLQIKVEHITLEGLLQADETVICNSLYGALPVREIQGKVIKVTQLAHLIRGALST